MKGASPHALINVAGRKVVSDELDLRLRNKNVFDCQGKIEYNRKVQGGITEDFPKPLRKKGRNDDETECCN